MIRILSILFLALLVSSSYGQTEPITQPSNLNFSGIKSYRVSTSFSSSGADGHLVVISKNPISFSPTDNVEYQKGQRISDIKVGIDVEKKREKILRIAHKFSTAEDFFESFNLDFLASKS